MRDQNVSTATFSQDDYVKIVKCAISIDAAAAARELTTKSLERLPDLHGMIDLREVETSLGEVVSPAAIKQAERVVLAQRKTASAMVEERRKLQIDPEASQEAYRTELHLSRYIFDLQAVRADVEKQVVEEGNEIGFKPGSAKSSEYKLWGDGHSLKVTDSSSAISLIYEDVEIPERGMWGLLGYKESRQELRDFEIHSPSLKEFIRETLGTGFGIYLSVDPDYIELGLIAKPLVYFLQYTTKDTLVVDGADPRFW